MSLDVALEIAHVLLIDIVGYSKLLVNEQIEQVQRLKEIVRSTERFRAAEDAGGLTKIATGDGVALIFYDSPEDPVRCAIEIAERLKEFPDLRLRMGIHSGPVNRVIDVNDELNVAGAGINIAQRVMDCGDAGHILLSRHVADDLGQYRQWQSYLHDLGECQVKHGLRLHIVNLAKNDVGNAAVPSKLKRGRRAARALARAEPHAVEPTRWPMAIVLAAIALCVMAVVLSWLISHRVVSSEPSRIAVPPTGKSIAVLPFENLTEGNKDQYLAAGVQDEILTDLSRIADLKVISRTSVMQYAANARRNLRDIARALGVTHVLEGSVQRDGDRLRVTAQLIDAVNDATIWGERYDRDIADLFAMQADVAEKIVTELKAKLTPREKSDIEAPRTKDMLAVSLYERAKQLIYDAVASAEGDKQLSEAVHLLDQAIARDPQFALAYYQLAHAHDQLHLVGADHTPERAALAQAAIDALRRLQPESGEAHLASAKHFYWVFRDYHQARSELIAAQQRLPNDPTVYLLQAYIDRRQSRWPEAISNFRRAISLDPRNTLVLDETALLFRLLRRYPEFAAMLDRVVALTPTDAVALARRAEAEIEWHANSRPLHDVITRLQKEDPASLPRVADLWLALAFYERDAAAGDRAVAVMDELGYYDEGVPFPRDLALGQVAKIRGNTAAAAQAFSTARDKLLQLVKAQGPYPETDCALAVVDSFLGRSEAIEEIDRATSAITPQQDSVTGAVFMQYAAIVYANLGEKDAAIQQLQAALQVPGYLSYGDLRLSPLWDPLRSYPQFEAVVRSIAPKN